MYNERKETNKSQNLEADALMVKSEAAWDTEQDFLNQHKTQTKKAESKEILIPGGEKSDSR